MERREITLLTADGFTLPGTVYEPASRLGEPLQRLGIALQINSAAGTPRRYYRAFAEYLAGRGYVVLTYDVRGVEREDGDLRASPASLLAAGGLDQPAATRWLTATYPELKPAILGHSVGGQMLGLSPELGRFRAAMLVASGHGYWRRTGRGWLRLRRALGVFVIGPPIVALLGYLPSFVLGGTPKGPMLARELMRFCRSPHFFCDEAGRPLRPFNDALRAPLRHLVIADDEVIAPGCELDAREFFPNAGSDLLLLQPTNYGLAGIGHFGLFRRAMPTQAWEEIAQWFEQALGIRGRTEPQVAVAAGAQAANSERPDPAGRHLASRL